MHSMECVSISHITKLKIQYIFYLKLCRHSFVVLCKSPMMRQTLACLAYFEFMINQNIDPGL